jgi:hypothetical protein
MENGVQNTSWVVRRGGQINRLPINQLITDINRTDITVTGSYWSVIG